MRYSMRWSEFNLSRLPALVGGHFLSDDVRDRGPLTNEAQHNAPTQDMRRGQKAWRGTVGHDAIPAKVLKSAEAAG